MSRVFAFKESSQLIPVATPHAETDLKKLGKGCFAEVFLVKSNDTGSVFACKRIQIGEMNDVTLQKTLKEVNILRTLRHPHIVRFYESHNSGSVLHVHMEYVDGVELAHVLKAQIAKRELFDVDRVMRWFSQLCFAIEYVHSHKIIHRDIKPTNVFLEADGDFVKLGDFGLGDIVPRIKSSTSGFVGTPYYMSPEVLRKQPYSNKADVWSLGILLYEMLTLSKPFLGKNLDELKQRVFRFDMKPLDESVCPPAVIRLVGRMLERQESRRISSAQLVQVPIVADMFSQLHPFDSQRTSRSCRDQSVPCSIAVVDATHSGGSDFTQSESFLGRSVLEDTQSQVDTSFEERRGSGVSTRRIGRFSIADGNWRNGQVVEKSGQFAVYRTGFGRKKKIIKFPRLGDRVYRAASQGHPHCVVIVRDGFEYAVSLPSLELLRPLLQLLDSEAIVRAGIKAEAACHTCGFDEISGAWLSTFVLVWRHYLFINNQQLFLYRTEVVDPDSSAFQEWPPNVTREQKLLLKHQDAYIALVTTGAAASRALLEAILVSSNQVWVSKIQSKSRAQARSTSLRLRPRTTRSLSQSQDASSATSTSPLSDDDVFEHRRPMRRWFSFRHSRSHSDSQSTAAQLTGADLRNEVIDELDNSSDMTAAAVAAHQSNARRALQRARTERHRAPPQAASASAHQQLAIAHLTVQSPITVDASGDIPQFMTATYTLRTPAQVISSQAKALHSRYPDAPQFHTERPSSRLSLRRTSNSSLRFDPSQLHAYFEAVFNVDEYREFWLHTGLFEEVKVKPLYTGNALFDISIVGSLVESIPSQDASCEAPQPLRTSSRSVLSRTISLGTSACDISIV
eukprot:m.200578 g.200578  ORF g.200578 m.200578 type:complete len:850 (-) comp14962_c0_seq1:1662-4211(-)